MRDQKRWSAKKKTPQKRVSTTRVHLCAVISVSMNRNPSNRGANFSVDAEFATGEDPPWLLWAPPSCKTQTRVSISPRKKKRIFHKKGFRSHVLKQNHDEKKDKFWNFKQIPEERALRRRKRKWRWPTRRRRRRRLGRICSWWECLAT